MNRGKIGLIALLLCLPIAFAICPSWRPTIPDDAPSKIRVVSELLEEDAFLMAQGNITELASTHARNPSVTAWYGYVSLCANDFEKSKTVFHKAYRVNPMQSDFLMGLMYAYSGLNQESIIEGILMSHLARYPDSSIAWMALGELRHWQGQMVEAISCLERSFTLINNLNDESQTVWPLFRLGTIYSLPRDIRTAGQYFSRAFRIDHDRSLALLKHETRALRLRENIYVHVDGPRGLPIRVRGAEYAVRILDCVSRAYPTWKFLKQHLASAAMFAGLPISERKETPELPKHIPEGHLAFPVRRLELEMLPIPDSDLDHVEFGDVAFDLDKEASLYHWVQHVDYVVTPASQVAVIMVDMWEHHWCEALQNRTYQLVAPVDAFLPAARDAGCHVIHAPSDVYKGFEGFPMRDNVIALHAQYKDVYNSTKVPNVKAALPKVPLPIGWAFDACETGGEEKQTDTRQHPEIRLRLTDAATAHGSEIYTYLRHHNITTLVYIGVHLDMCITWLRPFSMETVTSWGLNITPIIIPELTDLLYYPDLPPHVSRQKAFQNMLRHVMHDLGAVTLRDEMLQTMQRVAARRKQQKK